MDDMACKFNLYINLLKQLRIQEKGKETKNGMLHLIEAISKEIPTTSRLIDNWVFAPTTPTHRSPRPPWRDELVLYPVLKLPARSRQEQEWTHWYQTRVRATGTNPTNTALPLPPTHYAPYVIGAIMWPWEWGWWYPSRTTRQSLQR